ncbi:hypothetical protein RvY_00178 [Ramazzottius varieornatus]|uniref:Cytochrome P450 n=1 Tax=Ramazzottius varieornatus TaxID=947166 RepID=A0A1D1UFJ2_RAMVA|nr:hypothetical protein RvY_00178 [Ramazzottius varieornatus]
MYLIFSAFVLPLLFVWLLIWKKHRSRNLPPGPIVIPLFGTVTLFRYSTPYLAWIEWAKACRSDTIRLRTGPLARVACHDIDTVKKLFAKEEATGREKLFSHPVIAKGKGLIFSERPLWKHHRRFALTTLRNYGMGKTWLDDTILSEVDDLCKLLVDLDGRPIDPRRLLSHSISNVICALVFGRRFPHDDARFTKLTSLFDNILIAQFTYGRLLAFPFLKYIPGSGFHQKNAIIRKNFADVIAFIKELVNDHRCDDKSDEGTDHDYIDAYITEKAHQRTHQDGSNMFEDDQQLVGSLYDLFFAGTETT